MRVRNIHIHDYRDRVGIDGVEHDRLIAVRFGDFMFNLNLEEAEDLFDKLGALVVGVTEEEIEALLGGGTEQSQD